MDVKQAARRHSEHIIKLRRRLHKVPEPAYKEIETTLILKECLESTGIRASVLSENTGLIGHLNGGRPGKRVVLRVGIDALPLREKTGLPFASENEGKMHAGGNDANMAMLLGAAEILCEIRHELSGSVSFLFQSASEELGAKRLMESDILDGAEAIFGLRVLDAPKPREKVPCINAENGLRMAARDTFKVTLKGVSSHGAAPHLGRDAVVSAAACIVNIQTLVSRINNPLDTMVLTVDTVRGGQRFNIIANHAEIEGTLRSSSPDARESGREHLRRIVLGTAEATGCEAEFEYESEHDPVVNGDDRLNDIARNAAVRLYGENALAPMSPLTSSDDFSRYSAKIPSFCAFIGAPDGSGHPLGSDRFTVDENMLQYGAAYLAQIAADCTRPQIRAQK